MVVHSDRWRGYDGLVDAGFSKRYRVNHGANELAKSTQHINSIESFWGYAKQRLRKFRGIAPHAFYLRLKGHEWRFNMRHSNLYAELLKMLRKHPLWLLSSSPKLNP